MGRMPDRYWHCCDVKPWSLNRFWQNCEGKSQLDRVENQNFRLMKYGTISYLKCQPAHPSNILIHSSVLLVAILSWLAGLQAPQVVACFWCFRTQSALYYHAHTCLCSSVSQTHNCASTQSSHHGNHVYDVIIAHMISADMQNNQQTYRLGGCYRWKLCVYVPALNEEQRFSVMWCQFRLNTSVFISMKVLSPWWRLKHSVEISARLSELSVYVFEHWLSPLLLSPLPCMRALTLCHHVS